MKNILAKIKERLKDPFTVLVLLTIIFAFCIRLYYYFITLNQSFWWDEAEYLSIANKWVFGIPFDINIIRPILFPFIASIFFRLGLQETALRALMLLFSIAGVIYIYLLGKEMFNRKVGVISALLLSFFHLHLFLSNRLLVDMPTLTIFISILYHFIKGYEKKNKISLLILVPLIMLGVLMRFPLGLTVFIILIYLIVTNGFKFLKNKYLWISTGLSLLFFIPYAIWSIRTFGKINLFVAKGYYESNVVYLDYIKLLPHYFNSPIPFLQAYFPNSAHFLLVLFVIGSLTTLTMLFLGYDLFRKEQRIKMEFLLLLSLLVPFIYFGFFHTHVEARFILYCFPAAFLMIGKVLDAIYNYIKKYNQFCAVFLVVIILMLSGVTQLSVADKSIKEKKDNYNSLKEAGLWLKDNTESSAVIVSSAVPQITYYGEREIMGFGSKEDLERKIANKEVQYIILAVMERAPDWAYTYPEENKNVLKPIYTNFLDEEKKQLAVVIYKVI